MQALELRTAPTMTSPLLVTALGEHNRNLDNDECLALKQMAASSRVWRMPDF